LRKNSLLPSALPVLDSVLKGHGFSRADKANKMSGALAPEGCISGKPAKSRPFSAASSGAGLVFLLHLWEVEPLAIAFSEMV
jgi:hypothetical protein